MKTDRVAACLKYVFLIAVLVSFPINALSQPGGGQKDERWKYICYDINDARTTYYYDSETIDYISTNQVDVWLKISSPIKPQILRLEIACASGMFHLIESPFDIWGKRIKTAYIAGNWRIIPPDSEVYLLSKLVCK